MPEIIPPLLASRSLTIEDIERIIEYNKANLSIEQAIILYIQLYKYAHKKIDPMVEDK